MRLSAIVFVAVLLARGRASAQQADSGKGAQSLPPVMRLASGEWDWSGDSLTCRRNPHTVRFTNDSAVMVVRFRTRFDSTSKQEYRYRIVRYTDHTVTGQIEGEQRRTAAGKPMVWDLVLTGANSYRWRQTDGTPQAVTRAIVRCHDGEPLSEAQ